MYSGMIFGTGIDIVDISRFERFVRDGNIALLQRIFTPRELEYCSGKKQNYQHCAVAMLALEK